MHNSKSWIIFDGDNTLWNVEELYDNARMEFCIWMTTLGFEYLDVEYHQRTHDAELYKTMGYSKLRFNQSFIDTLLFFYKSPSSEQMHYVNQIAQKVFNTKAKEAEEVKRVFNSLKNTFKLALFTAGEMEIQRKRIDDFSCSSDFDSIKVVCIKDIYEFNTLIYENNIDVLTSWMIGDSIKSDILPAVESKLNAILVKADNWHPIEIGEHQLPKTCYIAHKLHEILPLIISIH